MAAWPTIADNELLERLGLDDEGFDRFMTATLVHLSFRECDARAIAHALAYPWSRPERSYLLTDGAVQLLGDLDRAERDALLARLARLDEPVIRLPLLAFGSNAAPTTLERKFAHFEDPEDRTVLAIAGALHDFDVGVAAQPTVYGSLPATLFPSPGTRVRAAVLWVTPAQFTQLAWSEISYRLGRIATRFEADEPGLDLDEVLGFASRFGAFSPEGAPVALAAIPAEGRTARAMTQEEMLDAAAAMAMGPDARAEDLIRATFEDFRDLFPRLAATVRRAATPFRSDRWTAFESPAGNGRSASL